jgi:hypothetical protein
LLNVQLIELQRPDDKDSTCLCEFIQLLVESDKAAEVGRREWSNEIKNRLKKVEGYRLIQITL